MPKAQYFIPVETALEKARRLQKEKAQRQAATAGRVGLIPVGQGPVRPPPVKPPVKPPTGLAALPLTAGQRGAELRPLPPPEQPFGPPTGPFAQQLFTPKAIAQQQALSGEMPQPPGTMYDASRDAYIDRSTGEVVSPAHRVPWGQSPAVRAMEEFLKGLGEAARETPRWQRTPWTVGPAVGIELARTVASRLKGIATGRMEEEEATLPPPRGLPAQIGRIGAGFTGLVGPAPSIPEMAQFSLLEQLPYAIPGGVFFEAGIPALGALGRMAREDIRGAPAAARATYQRAVPEMRRVLADQRGGIGPVRPAEEAFAATKKPVRPSGKVPNLGDQVAFRLSPTSPEQLGGIVGEGTVRGEPAWSIIQPGGYREDAPKRLVRFATAEERAKLFGRPIAVKGMSGVEKAAITRQIKQAEETLAEVARGVASGKWPEAIVTQAEEKLAALRNVQAKARAGMSSDDAWNRAVPVPAAKPTRLPLAEAPRIPEAKVVPTAVPPQVGAAATPLNDFLAGKPALEKGRLQTILNKQVNYQGRVMSRRQFVEEAASQGLRAEQTVITEGRGKGTFWVIGDFSSTKVEVDYLNFLKVRKPTTVPVVAAAPRAVAPAAAKEPWQMTQAEYVAQLGREEAPAQFPRKAPTGAMAEEERSGWAKLAHKQFVGKALSEGKPVPPEVLAEYPDLAIQAPRVAAAKPAAPGGFVPRYTKEQVQLGPKAVTGKQPHEMTRAEFDQWNRDVAESWNQMPLREYLQRTGQTEKQFIQKGQQLHKQTIASLLPEEAAIIPKHVLAEYPELAVQAPRAPAGVEVPTAQQPTGVVRPTGEPPTVPGRVAPIKLRPLAEEATKYDTFEDFERAFVGEKKHGRYYHITGDPNFKIDPQTGPRDMSSMAGIGQPMPEKGKLMITSDLDYWTATYKGERRYVAIIDMSEVPKEKYQQVKRGFGNEFWVDDPSKAKVIKVVSVPEAKRDATLHHKALPQTPDELRKFYNQVKAISKAAPGEPVPAAGPGAGLPPLGKVRPGFTSPAFVQPVGPTETFLGIGRPGRVPAQPLPLEHVTPGGPRGPGIPPTVAGGGPTPPDDYVRLVEALRPERPGIRQRISDAKNTVLRAFYDRNYPLKQLERETGVPVHQLAQVVPGSTASGENIVRKFFQPTYEPLGKDVKFLEQYMVLMRNHDILARNPHALLPGNVRGWAGNLAAEHKLEQTIGAERFTRIEKAARKLWEANEQYGLDLLEKEGFLTAQGHTAIKSAHPHYIPFQRQDFADVFAQGMTRPEASVSSAGIEKMLLEGSTRTLDEPLAHLLSNPIKVQQLIFRNRAARAIVAALKEREKLTGETLVKDVVGAAEHSQKWDTVSFFLDGKKMTVQVPTEYASVAKGLETEAPNILSRTLLTLSAPLRHGAVTYNPAFLIVNPLRDAYTAFFRERLIPLSPDYFRGWVAVIRKNATFDEAAQSGALLSGITDTMRSTEALSRVRRLGAITVKSPMDALLVLPRLIEKANIVAEQSTRVATFRKLRAQGVDALEAAVRARDVTVDFSKSGTVMKVINQIVPFSNAGLQGTINILRVIKNNPKWAIIAALPFGVATVLSRVNNMRFETSKDIPAYEYTNNWVVQIGEYTTTDGTKKPMYIKMPKGPVGSQLTFPIEALFSLASREDNRSAAEIFLEAGMEAVKATAPIEPSVGGVLPPLGQTGIGLETNTNLFTGAPIVPRREERLLPEQQFGPETSKAAVFLGQKFKISPRLIEFAAKDYTAGTGQLGLWLLDVGLGAIGYEPEAYGVAIQEQQTKVEQVSRIPGISRFLGIRGTQEERLAYRRLDKMVEEDNRRFAQIPGTNRLGLTLGKVGDSLNGVELTPEQRGDYQQLMADVVIPGMQAYQAQRKAGGDPEKEREVAAKTMGRLKGEAREQFWKELLIDAEALAKKSPPEVAQQYRDLVIMRDYFFVEDNVLSKVASGARQAWDQYKMAEKGVPKPSAVRIIEERISDEKERLRRQNPQLDALLFKWGYTTSFKSQQAEDLAGGKAGPRAAPTTQPVQGTPGGRNLIPVGSMPLTRATPVAPQGTGQRQLIPIGSR